MDRVCVFGATGFIGSAITDVLDRNGLDWIGISRFEQENLKIINLSLEQKDELVNVLSDYPIVINAMGSFKPGDFEQNTKTVFQSFWDNLQLFSQVLVNAPIKKMVHISSGGTVYGECGGVAAREEDWLSPISWYGKAKAIEESMLEKAAIQSGFNYTCARVSNPFGNDKFSNHGFIDVLVNTIQNGGSFNTFANKDYSRDFIYSHDMAEAILALLQREQSERIEIFNIGSGKSTSLHSIMRMAKNIVNDFQYKLERLDTDYDVIQSCLDVSKMEGLGVQTDKFVTIENYLYRKLTGNE